MLIARRFFMLFTLALFVGAVVAGSALGATTISRAGGTVTITGGPEVNAISVGVTLPDFKDPGGIVVGPGCTQGSPDKASCGWDFTSVEVDLGDGDDQFIATMLSLATTTIRGGGGNDQLSGGSENDQIFGGDGNDTLYGQGGDDTIRGEAGNDKLEAGGDSDTIDGGPGTDSIRADGYYGSEDGNDTIAIRDGESDSASCGLGADRVTADSIDVVDTPDCEVVDIASTPTPPPSTTNDAMVVLLTSPSKVKVATVLGKGLRITCDFLEAGTFTAQLRVTGAQSRKLGRSGTIVLAEVRGKVAEDAYWVRLKPKPRYRAALRRVRNITATVRVVGRNSAGTSTDTDTATVRIVR